MSPILPHLPLMPAWRHRATSSLLAGESFRARGTYDGRRWAVWAYECDASDGLGRYSLLLSVPVLSPGNECPYVVDALCLRCDRVETLMAFLATIDEGAAFVCPECMRGMPPSMGAADDAPDLCDDCWAARY
jgi:hypothetical protein